MFRDWRCEMSVTYVILLVKFRTSILNLRIVGPDLNEFSNTFYEKVNDAISVSFAIKKAYVYVLISSIISYSTRLYDDIKIRGCCIVILQRQFRVGTLVVLIRLPIVVGFSTDVFRRFNNTHHSRSHIISRWHHTQYKYTAARDGVEEI